MAHQTPPGNLRIGHAERDRTIALLREHTAAGRLDLDEFEERVGRITTAKTADDLDAVLADLPRLPSQVPPPQTWGPWGPAGRGWTRQGEWTSQGGWAQPIEAYRPPNPSPPGTWKRPASPAARTGWRVVPFWARIVVIMIAIWAVTGAGYFWPVWVIVPLAIMAVTSSRHRCGGRHRGDFTA